MLEFHARDLWNGAVLRFDLVVGYFDMGVVAAADRNCPDVRFSNNMGEGGVSLLELHVWS